MPDRTAQCEPVFVTVVGRRDRRKEVARRVRFVAVELIRGAMDLIRARLGSDRDRSRALELGLLAVRVNLEFADHIDGGQGSHAVAIGVSATAIAGIVERRAVDVKRYAAPVRTP